MTQPTPCSPWCTDHQADTPHELDQLCRHRVTHPAYGTLSLTHCLIDGHTIALWAANDELTLDQAEALFHAGLTLIATARASTLLAEVVA